MFKISLRVIFLISAISLMLNVKTAVSNGEKINNENEDYNFSNIKCNKLKKDEIELVFQGRGGVSFNIKLEMDKKLKKGIDLLNRGKYEDAARFFESFLLTNPQIFDQLVAANIGSFNSLALKSGEGAGYFEKKVEAHPEDYISAYYFGIFKILSGIIFPYSATTKRSGSNFSRSSAMSFSLFGLRHFILFSFASFEILDSSNVFFLPTISSCLVATAITLKCCIKLSKIVFANISVPKNTILSMFV